MVPKEYGGGILVVFMIGLSKYFDLILGNNNAIILILNIIAQFFFRCYFGFLTVGLNMIFIPIYGILGSAFATLLSITLYSLAKLMFVVKRLHLFPLLNKRYILWV
jgi:hypothetical protein